MNRRSLLKGLAAACVAPLALLRPRKAKAAWRDVVLRIEAVVEGDELLLKIDGERVRKLGFVSDGPCHLDSTVTYPMKDGRILVVYDQPESIWVPGGKRYEGRLPLKPVVLTPTKMHAAVLPWWMA